MTEQLLDETEIAGKRRIFLSVLCILMWIGCAGVIAINLFISSELSERIQGYYADYDRQLRWLIWCSIAFVVLALTSLVGSVLMWKLRRLGFYLYLTAQLLSLALLFYMLLQSHVRIGHLTFFDTLAMAAIFGLPLLFIVLFALNLKQMRR